MASVYDLKPKFQNLLRPLLSFLVKNRFTPNIITIIALLGSVIAGVIVYFAGANLYCLLILPIWLFIRMALNAIDGMMAREFNMSSDMGAVLNELGDVISDFVLYFPLVFVDKASAFLIILFCVGAIITEFCGILGKTLGVSRHYEGPMGKSDRAFFIGTLAFITVLIPDILFFYKWFFMAGIILLILTCKNRISNALLELKNRRN